MKLQKSQTGFTAVHALLFIVIIGIIGFAGWKVYDAGNSTTANVSTISTPTKLTTNNPIANNFVDYQNKDLGIKFSYPKQWGEVSLIDYVNQTCAEQIKNVKDQVKGNIYQLKFSKNIDKVVNLTTKDFDLGLQLKCFYIAPYNFNYKDLKGKGFKTESSVEYVISDDNFECSYTTTFLYGLVPLDNKRFNGLSVQLHSAPDPDAVYGRPNGGQGCSPGHDVILKTQGLLNQEDKTFMKTIKAL